MTVNDEIAVFFESYVDAFSRGDVDALCALWEPVGLFPTSAGNFAMDTQTFRGHLLKLMNFYKAQGVTRPEGSLLDATELFPNVAQARMVYRMLSHGDELIASWEHVYILRRKDGWQVSLAIADGEMAAWGPRLSEFL
jgi:hypothetical protein